MAFTRIADLITAAEHGEYVGGCTECGHIQDGVEPDAEKYFCDQCGMPSVSGVEVLLLAE